MRKNRDAKLTLHFNNGRVKAMYANILDAALTLDEYERKKLAAALIASTLSEVSRKDVCTDINFIDREKTETAIAQFDSSEQGVNHA